MSQFQDILTILKNRNFSIPLGDDGVINYMIVPVDREHLVDLSKELETQLKKENKYGWYTSICLAKSCEISEQDLPIFGDSEKFITKWSSPDYEDVLKKDLRDKYLGLYNRIMTFPENKYYL